VTKKRAKSNPIHVVEFGRKLWLLMVIHQAIHKERDGEMYGSWFADTLFEVGPAGLGSRKSVAGVLDTILEVYSDVKEAPKTVEPSDFPFKHGRLNRMLGADLLANGTSPERADGPTYKAITALFEPAKIVEVERRVVYRCARGFLMVPYGYLGVHEKKDPSSIAQLQNAQSTDPSKFQFDQTPMGRERANKIAHEADYIKDRALAVLRAFCGNPSKRKTAEGKAITVCGESYEAFEKAALKYYCRDDSELVAQECPVHLFDTTKKRAMGNTDPMAPPLLSEGKHRIVGVGQSLFGATHLAFEATVPNGQLKVQGHLDCSGNEELEFTKLNINFDRPVGTPGFKIELNWDKERDGKKYYRQDDPTLITTAANTAALVQCWEEPHPLYDFQDNTAPFYVSFVLEAPLATISHKSGGGTGGNKFTTQTDVVSAYLRNLMAPGQEDWVPPKMVPVISDGFAAFGNVDGIGET